MTNTIKLLAVASVFLASSAFAANPPAAPEGLPVPHELYGEMTLESLIAVMAAIGLDLRTERLN